MKKAFVAAALSFAVFTAGSASASDSMNANARMMNHMSKHDMMHKKMMMKKKMMHRKIMRRKMGM
jgi:hypothetical protein